MITTNLTNMWRILIAVLCVALTSCDDSVTSSKIDNESYVKADFFDSTKWEPAKIYIPQSNKLYFKTERGDVYQVWGNAPLEFIIALVVGLLFGFLIGMKINEP